jgi:glycosyltransferase involved in cell wall biosynthesis
MRVCLVTGSHPVDYTRFLHREATSLARAGHEVHLIGLKSSCPAVVPPGVFLHELPTRSGISKRRTTLDVEESVADIGPAVCHCCDPWSLAAGLRLKRRHVLGRLIYDATEDFPAAYSARTDLGTLRSLGARLYVADLERQACAEADAVIDTNPTRARRFARHGRRADIVGNFPPVEALPAPSSAKKPLFAYTGPITRHRGFLQLLAALAMARAEFADASIVVIGDFDPRDDIRVAAGQVVRTHSMESAVQFTGRQDYSLMFETISQCAAGMILLQRQRPNDFSGQPNKLFEFMGSGLAVIASDFPEIGSVLRHESCGLPVDPASPASIAAAMLEVLARPAAAIEMGLRGRSAVLERYNWSVAERVLLGVYERLLC